MTSSVRRAICWVTLSAVLAAVIPVVLAIRECSFVAGVPSNRPLEILLFGGCAFLRAWAVSGLLPVLLWTAVASVRPVADRWQLFLPAVTILVSAGVLLDSSELSENPRTAILVFLACVVLPRILPSLRPGTFVTGRSSAPAT